MGQSQKQKKILLEQSWKNFLIAYALSIILIPVFGVGLLMLYFVRRRQKKLCYIFRDDIITRADPKYQRNIDLVNIERLEVRQSWLQQKLDIGDLKLYTSTISMLLEGLEEPWNLKQMLGQAIKAQVGQQKEQKKTQARESNHQAGDMERNDYLTGLWQQGLISNEDYEKERNNINPESS